MVEDPEIQAHCQYEYRYVSGYRVDKASLPSEYGRTVPGTAVPVQLYACCDRCFINRIKLNFYFKIIINLGTAAV